MTRPLPMRSCLPRLVFFHAAIACMAAAPEPSPSASEREPAGWINLLPSTGSDLNGWTRLPIPPGGKLNSESQWTVDSQTGYLVCQGDKGHEWLRWDREMSDFIFHVEW